MDDRRFWLLTAAAAAIGLAAAGAVGWFIREMAMHMERIGLMDALMRR